MLDQAAAALRPAAAAMVRTAVVGAGLTLALAAGCYLVAASGTPARGLAAALVAVALAIPAGAMVAWQQALAAGAVGFTRNLGLTRRVVDALFTPFDGTAAGLPLAEAEQMLRDAALRHVPGKEGGALRGAIERRLVAVVESVTLARFRAAGGDLDPIRVREQLAASADALVTERIEGGARTSTVLLASGTVVIAVAIAVALRVAR